MLAAAGQDNTRERQKIAEWQGKVKAWTEKTGLRRDYAREAIGTAGGRQVSGLGRKAEPKEDLRNVDNIRSNKTSAKSENKTLDQNNNKIYHRVKPNINDIANHTTQRQEERGVSIDEIKDAIEHPLQIGEIRKDGTYRIIGEHVTVGVSATTGRITTTWRTGAKTKNKLKGKNKK